MELLIIFSECRLIFFNGWISWSLDVVEPGSLLKIRQEEGVTRGKWPGVGVGGSQLPPIILGLVSAGRGGKIKRVGY
jgi:hypothetical protein